MSVESTDQLWEAVTDPTRRQILDLLVTQRYATATTLATEITVSRQAISKHLAVLEAVGLIHSRKQGREVRYALDEERLAQASSSLSEVADRWAKRLWSIKQIAERTYASESARATVAHADPSVARDRGR